MDSQEADYRKANLSTRLELARMQTTPVQVLAQLVDDQSEEVRQAVALNANASEEILSQLGREFPEEVVQNPVFGILALENPNSLFVHLAKARSAATSPEALAEFGKSTEEEILIAVSSNPNTPSYVLEGLVDNPPVLGDYEYMESDDYSRIFSAIVQNANTPVSVIRKVYEDWSIATYAIARSPRTPVDILEKLSQWQNHQMQLALIENSALPSHLVARLSIERDERIQQAAQTHPNKPENIETFNAFIQGGLKVPPDLLSQLATDSRAHVRLLVAKHPNTSAVALKELAHDKASNIAHSAAYNPSANEAVLKEYAAYLVHQHSVVSPSNQSGVYRTAVQLGAHPKTTSEVLDLLMDGLPYLEDEIAGMETVPVATLVKIAKRVMDVRVSEKLARNPALPAEGLGFLFISVTQSPFKAHSIEGCLKRIAQHPNLSELLFFSLLKRPGLRTYLASNPKLTNAMREQLIATKDTRTLSTLARNPNTPPDILLRLIGDRIDVRAALATNEKLPPALVETLADDELFVRMSLARRRSPLPISVLQKFSQDKEPQICACIALRPETPLEILERLIQHPEEIVRGSVGRNSKVTPLMLLALASEDSVEIRAHVALHPEINEATIEVLFRKTAVALPVELDNAKRSQAEAEEEHRNLGFRLLMNGQPLDLQPYNEYEERVRRGEPHEKMVMARIAAHPNTPQRLRDRIQSDYGISYERGHE